MAILFAHNSVIWAGLSQVTLLLTLPMVTLWIHPAVGQQGPGLGWALNSWAFLPWPLHKVPAE